MITCDYSGSEHSEFGVVALVRRMLITISLFFILLKLTFNKSISKSRKYCQIITAFVILFWVYFGFILIYQRAANTFLLHFSRFSKFRDPSV
jgi:Mn2+/Fe2+ NRAMP family transporter